MRKSLIIILVLFVLCLGGFALVSASVSAPEEDIELKALVSYGDVSAAEGLEVDLRNHMNYHLFWDTKYEPGRESKTDTKFEFEQGRYRGDYEYEYEERGIIVDMAGNFGFSSSGYIDLEEWSDREGYRYLVPMIRDIASRAPGDGQIYTESIYLRDYYEYYPFEFQIDMPMIFKLEEDEQGYAYYDHNGYITGDDRAAFQEFFKIPVLKEEQLEIGVAKDGDGQIFEINVQSSMGKSSVHFEPYGIVTEDGCYFTFSIYGEYDTENADELDLGLIPGGYGIYYVGVNTDGEYKTINADSLTMAYPLSPDEEIRYFALNSDGDNMLLVTRNERIYYLTVIDTDTGEEVQRVQITEFEPNEHESYWLNIYDNDGFMVFRGDDKLILLEEQPDGSYECKIDVDNNMKEIEDELGQEYYGYGESFAWNGERLAIAGFTRFEMSFAEYPYTGSLGKYHIESCGFSLNIYDADGLQYYGKYGSSLDVVMNRWGRNCEPLSSYRAYIPLTWKN